jgi:hypothetical protein
MNLYDDPSTKKKIDQIENLQYKVLSWVHQLAEKKKNKSEVDELLTIYHALEDEANLLFHLYKGRKMLKYLKDKERKTRHSLELHYEYAGESDSEIGLKPWRNATNTMIISQLKEIYKIALN